jgi:hypothetical protein
MADFTGILAPVSTSTLSGDLVRTFDGVLATPAPTTTILRRALVSGEYIYFTGSPPPGASDIVVMST